MIDVGINSVPLEYTRSGASVIHTIFFFFSIKIIEFLLMCWVQELILCRRNRLD